jgi:hypothetical protein
MSKGWFVCALLVASTACPGTAMAQADELLVKARNAGFNEYKFERLSGSESGTDVYAYLGRLQQRSWATLIATRRSGDPASPQHLLTVGALTVSLDSRQGIWEQVDAPQIVGGFLGRVLFQIPSPVFLGPSQKVKELLMRAEEFYDICFSNGQDSLWFYPVHDAEKRSAMMTIAFKQASVGQGCYRLEK